MLVMEKFSSFDFHHKSGVLMPLFSLPSPYGIGTFGKPCKDFVDFLAKCGQKCWQVLPLCPTAYGDSPYQSPSTFAGNPYFLDLDDFVSRGLLTKKETETCLAPQGKVDYGKLWETRFDVLRLAHSRFVSDDSYRAFCDKNAAWLDDYALFFALKSANEFRAWTEWSDEFKTYASAKKLAAKLSSQTDFWKWVQFEFDSQWQKVRDYANERGIQLVGDLPIYVALDSADVWSRPSDFLLDEHFVPTVVAGCPPDDFATEGQLWGNPIYDWAKMEKDGFAWWLARFKRCFELYDVVRVDHFRGFAGYYAIPQGKSAKDGSWQKGYGRQLFDALNKALPNARIIAEDLGFITDDVRDLLAHTGYAGMKVLQFAFDDASSDYLPSNFQTSNCVVYTGTHDSECTASWAKKLVGKRKALFERECAPRDGESATWALARAAMESKANLAVVPLWDFAELPDEVARINVPAVSEGNWTWRAERLDDELACKILRLTEQTGRLV